MSTEGMKNLEKLYVRKIRSRINEIGDRFIWTDAAPVKDVSAAETMEHLSIKQAANLKYRPVKDGFRWGKNWSTAWFRLRFTVPRHFKGEQVVLRFSPEGECIIFRNEKIVQGLDPNRKEYLLLKRSAGNEKIELYVEAGANSAFGDLARRTMRQPQLLVFNPEVWAAYYDLVALFSMIEERFEKPHALPPGDDTRCAKILFGLNKAVDLFDYDTPDRALTRAQALKASKLLKPLYDCKASASAQTIACFGHAHIDVAWLWRLAETVRKCGRTFSNVLELMDHYPEFIFVQSQPQLYEYTCERYPAIYEKIRQKVKSGQWVPTGGMWVEADCNVTSGESLVRQILFGTRFFKGEFNSRIEDLWLPDVFGYSAALPQILSRSGIKYFLTQKISWSQFSKFPYHSFRWEGIDGSRVLTHFPPANDYNSALKAPQMLAAANEYREKDRSPIQAVPFGYGDGGGGPNRDILERMRRFRDLEGMPKLEPMAPREFFKKLEKESVDLPTWVGELYLELHRGTFTTQALNKKLNRRAEFHLRETEMLSAINSASGAAYDQKTLNAMWKLTLLNQFHDIIHGSSIDEVYADSRRDYAVILKTTGELREKAFARLAGRVDLRGPGQPVLAFNSLSWERQSLISIALPPGKRTREKLVATAPDGDKSPVQVSADNTARFIGTLPSAGHAVFHLQPGVASAPVIAADTRAMENECLRVEFDNEGRVKRIYDKVSSREILAPGATGNRFVLFEDKNASFGGAWDMEIFYNDKPLVTDGKLLSVKVVERGVVRSVVRFKRAIGKSTLVQDVVLTAGSPRIDFVTTVSWGDEKDVLLKVAFPVNILSEKARYEIQFGNVERPTHHNRPQDFGMFEVPAQKWADLAEADYGVALLNDCKYGYDIHGNVMRLTLLRAPKYPGKTADVNQTHEFTYAILPHKGGYTNGVVRAGYDLNVPVMARAVRPAKRPSALPARSSAMSVSGENIVIDTLKKAEDDDALIVRLYEAHGSRGRRDFITALPVKRVFETDLMEKVEREINFRNKKVSLDFKPFQIITLKLVV